MAPSSDGMVLSTRGSSFGGDANGRWPLPSHDVPKHAIARPSTIDISEAAVFMIFRNKLQCARDVYWTKVFTVHLVPFGMKKSRAIAVDVAHSLDAV
ncbi:hypothetical protein GCM10027431_09820 [Lysobacter rhizosphaerae]